MSGVGEKRRFGNVRTISALPQKPTFIARGGMSQKCQFQTHALREQYPRSTPISRLFKSQSSQYTTRDRCLFAPPRGTLVRRPTMPRIEALGA
jgi:hypothetical protein